MDAAIIKNYIFDHAGEGETSLLMALAPKGVEIARVSENNTWYTKSAFNSSTEIILGTLNLHLTHQLIGAKRLLRKL